MVELVRIPFTWTGTVDPGSCIITEAIPYQRKGEGRESEVKASLSDTQLSLENKARLLHCNTI